VKNHTSRIKLKIVPMRNAIAKVGRSIMKKYTPPAAKTAKRISLTINPPAVMDNKTKVFDFIPLIAPAIHSSVSSKLRRHPMAKPLPTGIPPRKYTTDDMIMLKIV